MQVWWQLALDGLHDKKFSSVDKSSLYHHVVPQGDRLLLFLFSLFSPSFSLSFSFVHFARASKSTHCRRTRQRNEHAREETTEKYASGHRTPRHGTLAQLPPPPPPLPPVTKYCHLQPPSTWLFSGASADLRDIAALLTKGSEALPPRHGEAEEGEMNA